MSRGSRREDQGSAGPYSPTTGVSIIAARCNAPLSVAITSRAMRWSAARPPRDSGRFNVTAPPAGFHDGGGEGAFGWTADHERGGVVS